MSFSKQEFTNLSLTVMPGESVERCLDEYLKETKLDYRCDCGHLRSEQQWLFQNLPNILVLHLNRSTWNRTKDSPVHLSRKLLVTAADGHTVMYTLASVVNHFGPSVYEGHYICDGVYLPETDRWLIYDDNKVYQNRGELVCRCRQRSAYILFYERQETQAIK